MMKRSFKKLKQKEEIEGTFSIFFLYIFVCTIVGIRGESTDTQKNATMTILETVGNRPVDTSAMIKYGSETTTDIHIPSAANDPHNTSDVSNPTYGILLSLTDSGIFLMQIDGSKTLIKKTNEALVGYDPLSEQIFYTVTDRKLFYKLNLDGTNQQTIDDISNSKRLAIDWLERKIFVASSNSINYYVIRKNMKKVKEDGQISTKHPIDISLDIFHSVVYWSKAEDAVIIRSSYDGDNNETIHRIPDEYCWIRLAVDYKHQNIYFTCYSMIYKMKCDGSDKRQLVQNKNNVFAIALQGDDLFWGYGGVVKRANKYSILNQTVLKEDYDEVYDLETFYIRSDNYNSVQYDDLKCPEIARCFGMKNTWTCLQSNMICDGSPQCHGGLDEFYCCYDKWYNCSSIQELSLACTRLVGTSSYVEDSLDFDDWKNILFLKIFGSAFLSFRCSLQMKYLDDKLSERQANISHIQKHHILRQFTGPTVFDHSKTVILSGEIPSIKRDALRPFHVLNKLVLKSTNLEHIGIDFEHMNQNHSDNSKTSVAYEGAFQGLGNLRHLSISENQILSTIDNNALIGLENLHVLEIRNNKNLSTIKENAFNKLTNLRTLFISENSELLHTNEYTFSDFTALETLTLSHGVTNKIILTGNIPSLKNGVFYTDTIYELLLLKTTIKDVSAFYFGGIDNLKKLTLAENQFLSVLNNNAFNGLTFLTDLTISRNQHLAMVENDAFAGLESLTSLTISNNPLLSPLSSKPVGRYLFDNVWQVKMLNISGNKLHNFEDGLLDNLTNLEVIDLRSNNLLLTSNIFQKNKKLAYIYSDSYFFCCLKPYVIFNKNCYAPEDDISSCSDLIEDRQLCGYLWQTGIIAFFGNISVLLYRFLKDRKSLKETFSVFVVNLSCSDAIMGLYMLIIAIHDSLFKGEYVWYDYEWKQSFMCKMSGVMVLISSESSVISIGLITIDRFLAVVYPIGGKRLTLRQAYILSVLTWIISAVLAIVPILIYPQFYSYSGTCLALPLTGNFNPGWQISVAIFLGLNCIFFIFISIGQICILRKIILSARLAGRKNGSKEREVALFLLMVAVTDALCWFPVGILVTMALSGIRISRGVYAWIIVFVLPVNSAVNPFLYTFVPLCRRKKKKLTPTKVQDPTAGHMHMCETKITTDGLKTR